MFKLGILGIVVIEINVNFLLSEIFFVIKVKSLRDIFYLGESLNPNLWKRST